MVAVGGGLILAGEAAAAARAGARATASRERRRGWRVRIVGVGSLRGGRVGGRGGGEGVVGCAGWVGRWGCNGRVWWEAGGDAMLLCGDGSWVEEVRVEA